MNPKMNACVYASLGILKLEISNRNFHNEIDLNVNTEENQNKDDSFKYQTFNHNDVENLKKNSPFRSYFDNLIAKFSSHMSERSDYNISTDTKNTFY